MLACSALVMEGLLARLHWRVVIETRARRGLRPQGPEPYPLLVNILEVSGVPSARLVAAGFSKWIISRESESKSFSVVSDSL